MCNVIGVLSGQWVVADSSNFGCNHYVDECEHVFGLPWATRFGSDQASLQQLINPHQVMVNLLARKIGVGCYYSMFFSNYYVVLCWGFAEL